MPPPRPAPVLLAPSLPPLTDAPNLPLPLLLADDLPLSAVPAHHMSSSPVLGVNQLQNCRHNFGFQARLFPQHYQVPSMQQCLDWIVPQSVMQLRVGHHQHGCLKALAYSRELIRAAARQKALLFAADKGTFQTYRAHSKEEL